MGAGRYRDAQRQVAPRVEEDVMSERIPAGWYPQGDGTQRFWDGTRWTGDVAPATPAPETQSEYIEPALNRDDPRWDQPRFDHPVPPPAPTRPEPGASGPKSRWKWVAIPALVVALGAIVGLIAFSGPLLVRASTDEAAVPDPTVGTASTTPTSDTPKTAVPRPEQSGPVSSDADYAVIVDSAHLTHDYGGKDAIVINFSFSNNSDKTTSFLQAVETKVFQNGVELKSNPFITGDPNYDNGSILKEVKPGATQHGAQWAWLLDDRSDVTVEVEEANGLIATRVFGLE